MIAFTLCSNNYFSQAATLAISYLRHHPDSNFIIGIVDRSDVNINYEVCDRCNVIFAESIGISDFYLLVKKYNITELNTVVKPFFFRYLFRQGKSNKIVYLDPDIYVYSYFEEIDQLLNRFNIILTPQSVTPIDDGDSPSDIHLLGSGIFNLGFIALSNYQYVKDFLDWWAERLIKYGYGSPSNHMFYDQLWINLVPAYYDNYYILKHLGYNTAAWNMHERNVTLLSSDKIIINECFQLRFWHFSGYKFDRPTIFCSYSARYTFDDRPSEAQLFLSYNEAVRKNGYDAISKLKPLLDFAPSVSQTVKFGLRSRVKIAMRVLLKGFV